MVMKKWIMLSFLLIYLAGCQPFMGGQAVIDWLDFIQWNGLEYNGVHNSEIADASFIEKEIGEVRFKVADNVSNPSYQLKDGDAAFHEKGTKLYSIKGKDNIIAVKDEAAINGYRIYFDMDNSKYKWHFDDVSLEQVKKIEIFQSATPAGNQQIATIEDKAGIENFLEILSNSKEAPAFQPNTSTGDPISYQIILYTDEPITYKYSVHYDGNTYFWYPSETAILSDDIQHFISEK